MAAVLRTSENAVAYMLSNADNVLPPETSGNSPGFVPAQVRVFVAAVLPVPIAVQPVPKELKASFTGDHIFRRCAISGGGSPAPFVPIYDALIDHGAHMVLICDSLVTEMNLKHRKLPNPIEVETAMPPPGEPGNTTSLSEYVKLMLYDPVTGWVRVLYALLSPPCYALQLS